jgi:hypothetical protein
MDFVTWVLLRFDSFMAETNKERAGGVPSVAKRSPERPLPVSTLKPRETPTPISRRPAA